MSSRLTRNVRALTGAALMVASVAMMIVLLPSVAEAQSEGQNTSSVVVHPGDCLWSIASERLGPNASPQQIANGVEGIYAANRGRIGTDPNLIFPGQELSLPSMGEPPKAEPLPAATPAQEGADSAAASPTARAGKLETERVSSTAVGETGNKARRAPDPVVVSGVLPEMPTKSVTPHVGSPSASETPSPYEFFTRTVPSLLYLATSADSGFSPQDDLLRRRLLGLGIIGFTLFVAALILWKLPMKRPTNSIEMWVGTTMRPVAYASHYDAPPPHEGEHRSGGSPRRAPKPEAIESGWESSAELEDSLRSMPLQETLIPLENLTKTKFHAEVALEELAWLDERRGLFDTERHAKAALQDLLCALSAMEKAHG